MAPELPIKAFDSAAEWETWLAKHHARAEGVWLQFLKKGHAPPGALTYAQALDVALCFGWIDGQLKAHDSTSWLHKFTPRRPKSAWSKRNTEHAKRLIREGRMKAAGLHAIEAAKADGRWKVAYDSPSKSTIPADFLEELRKDAKAHAFFRTLNKANLYAIAYRLQTAKKPETRERRIKAILQMLAKGEKFH